MALVHGMALATGDFRIKHRETLAASVVPLTEESLSPCHWTLQGTAGREEGPEFARIRIISKSNLSDFVSQEFATTMRQTVFSERDRKHQKS
jgi:hypothetical protein